MVPPAARAARRVAKTPWVRSSRQGWTTRLGGSRAVRMNQRDPMGEFRDILQPGLVSGQNRGRGMGRRTRAEWASVSDHDDCRERLAWASG